MEYKEFIVNTLKETSEIAIGYFGKVKGTTKIDDNNQVLTEADLAIGNKIVSLIGVAYPSHNIIDEESGVVDNNSKYTWVVDPIDGTSNFALGIPTYGIIVGLLHDDIPVAGGIALPAFSEIYIAEKNQGAFCNNEKISVSKKTKLISELVAYGIDGHQEDPSLTYEESRILGELVLRIRNLRMSNSVFDGAMVAKGKYGGYLNRTSKIWDNVGLQIIIEEAGGTYTDFYGKPVVYSDPIKRFKDNFTFCMGAPILHKEIQKVVIV